MKVLITICARAGSKRLPGKNVKKFHGKSLIQWTIDQAIEFQRSWDCDIVVCTDIDQIFYDVLALGRPDELNGDDVPKLDVIRYALRQTEIKENPYDVVIDLDVTNPCRTAYDISNATHQFERSDIPTLISVVPARRRPGFNMVFSMGGRTYLAADSRLDTLNEFYDLNAAIYIYSSDWLAKGKIHPVEFNSGIYIMEPWQAFDIDTQVDWEIAELMFEKYLLNERK